MNKNLFKQFIADLFSSLFNVLLFICCVFSEIKKVNSELDNQNELPNEKNYNQLWAWPYRHLICLGDFIVKCRNNCSDNITKCRYSDMFSHFCTCPRCYGKGKWHSEMSKTWQWNKWHWNAYHGPWRKRIKQYNCTILSVFG